MARKINLPDEPATVDPQEPEILPPSVAPEPPVDRTAEILKELADQQAEKARIQQIADEAARKAFPKPVPIVDLEDVIQSEALTPEQQQAGVKFWFGELGVITFPDKSTFHAKQKTQFITEPDLIEKIKAFAEKYPTAKIFIQ